MAGRSEDNNSSTNDDSCFVFTRSEMNEQRSSIVKANQVKNCSKPRHVLCRIQSMLGYHSMKACFNTPLTLDLPAVISNHLTYELCLSVCGNLGSDIAVLNINKCYCFNVGYQQMASIRRNHAKYNIMDCGKPCSGML